MRALIIVFVVFFCQITQVLAGDKKYPVSDIPDSLKQGMYAVVREDMSRFEILDINRTIENVHYVVTILNEKGKQYAAQTLGYDKLTRITTFKGNVYDADGNEIKRLKQSEIGDQSAIDGETLFADDRVKFANLSQAVYPYTVEYEYEIQRNFLYTIPTFILYQDDEVSIQKISYEVTYPKSLTPRFRLTNISAPFKRDISTDKETVQWIFTNVRPKKFEKYGPLLSQILPSVKAAPSRFEYGGYSGDMATWADYGKWNIKLMEGRQELPPATKQKILDITKDLPTTELKAKAIYEFMQNKTRYVNIQEGIGGMQPFEASVVDNVGYGDCKALSNYMVSLLKVAGIKGYYTRIKAGDDEPDIVSDFPSHQTNHVIVSVPNGKDTLWMECTSQIVPFGWMGTFTGGRHAIIITEEGGKLVRTPFYNAEKNVQSRSADVVVDALGNAIAKVKTVYSGTQYENGNLNFILGNQTDKQQQWVQRNTDIPSFTVNSFTMSEIRNKIPSAVVKLDLTLARYASVSGKRFFISPNLMNKTAWTPEKSDKRRTDIVFNQNYVDYDTVVFHFPENLYPEFLPAPAKISSRFGEYETNYRFDAGKLIYIRKMKVKKGVFPKESYNEFVDFYKNISKSDNAKLVFLNKT